MSNIVLPAEWAPQCAVLLTWPHEQTDWAENLPQVETTFLEIAKAVCKYQNLIISCQSFDRLEKIADALHAAGIPPEKVGLYCVPSNDSWCRDHGPITVYDGHTPVLLDFRFNAWGGKFDYEKDDQITTSLLELGAFDGAAIRHIPYILEGGSIESDGQGTVMTTSECVLTATRNPDATKESVEASFKEYFGASRVLWLDHGYLAGDDTDSHIDTLARFCDEETICYVQCNDPSDEHYDALKKMEGQLQAARKADGSPYKLIPLPMADACFDDEGHRLPATYANFLIINGAVLAPVYGVPQDQEAISQLKFCFPDRTIEAIDCRSLIEQHGSLHCVTMQLPDGVI
ncbi:agmatine deiminase [Hahella sp. CCB-MM4]|uniref:agmatine deiminase family protein n=1 Tax=Hahella sp. (strain CCB-MM4) TaxID=1926491 RepID=UPI000B9B6EF1|nr:agmatine deiminase family protein [Hahella sp. CCB-MM4]OZG73690.1 agmatine deiminase [Hahella sp. CCB-MM4]